MSLWSDMDGDARRAACLKGRTAGLSASQIAKPLGCTRMAVIGMLKRLKDSGVRVPASPHGPGSNPGHKKSARTGLAIVSKAPTVAPAKKVIVANVAHNRATVRIEPPLIIARENAFEPIPGTTPITLAQFGPLTCKWAVDGVYGPSRLFCGQPKECEASYCRAHQAISYQAPEIRLRRHKIATATLSTRAA